MSETPERHDEASVAGVLAQLQRELQHVNEQLKVEHAMTLQWKTRALADKKAALIHILAGEALAPMAPYLPDDCAIIALKVWSAVLREAIWVVADDLPREAWPTDALAYTHQEVRILRQIGQDTLAWVHATKRMFGAQVMASRRRPRSHPEAPA